MLQSPHLSSPWGAELRGKKPAVLVIAARRVAGVDRNETGTHTAFGGWVGSFRLFEVARLGQRGQRRLGLRFLRIVAEVQAENVSDGLSSPCVRTMVFPVLAGFDRHFDGVDLLWVQSFDQTCRGRRKPWRDYADFAGAIQQTRAAVAEANADLAPPVRRSAPRMRVLRTVGPEKVARSQAASPYFAASTDVILFSTRTSRVLLTNATDPRASSSVSSLPFGFRECATISIAAPVASAIALNAVTIGCTRWLRLPSTS